jgi:hypothetical protein
VAASGVRAGLSRTVRPGRHARTVAPIDIPLDDDGVPILAALVDRAGRRYAESIDEEYTEDPFRRAKEAPHQGGYCHVTAQEWQAFDAAMAAYDQARRMGLAPASSGKTVEAPPTTFGPIEHAWPYARCDTCQAEARFCYRNGDGTMRWFCAAHRLAKNWADARRGGAP